MSQLAANPSATGTAADDPVVRALAAEFFSRTGAAAPIGLMAIVAVGYPHASAVPHSLLLLWACLLAVPLTASTLFARHARQALERGANPLRLVNIECLIAGFSGASWGLLPVLFSSGVADPLYFFRLMVICTAVTFVIPTLAVFLRCWSCFVGAMSLIALPWLLTQPEAADLRAVLLVGLGTFLAMALSVAIDTRQRIVQGKRDHLAVKGLGETLATGQAQLQQRIEEKTEELSAALAALQEKETVLSQSQRLASVGYFIFDPVQRAFRTSEMFDKIFGIGPDEPRSFENWLSGIHSFHRHRISNMAAELRREGGTAEWSYPIVRRDDGKTCWVRNRSVVELDANGHIVKWFGNVQDITQQKLAEIELEQHRHHLEQMVAERTRDLIVAKEAAEVANAAKDTFLANISHELRTPLNGVIGMAGLASGMATEPKQRDYLEKIVRSGEHLNRIINDLLDLSKIAAGRMELEIVAFDPRAVVRHCTAVMAPRTAEKGLYLRETIEAAVPEVIRGDPHRLEQILLNLLGNAVKFTETGGIEIEVAPAPSSGGRYCLGIRVTDSGSGMAAEALSRLFKPFSQADATVSRRHGGTGLGLAISHRLAQMMGGDIAVSSQPGQGTTFTVRICCEIGDSAELPGGAPPIDAPPASYRDVRILVAEDQDINREIIEALLTDIGIEVRMAVNGREAVDLLQRSGPDAFDLVLMDIQMPIMDGLSATREIRRRPGFETLPIVALTAHTMEHEKAIGRAAGVSDHIGKPFDIAGIQRTLARWIPAHKQIAAPAAIPPPAGGIDIEALPGIDVAGALGRFGGREDRLLHWLRNFAATCHAVPAQIRHEIAAGHWTTAAQTAHAFKGRTGMLGLTTIHPRVSALERALRERAPVDALLAGLEQALGDLRPELNRLSGEPAAGDHGSAAAATPLTWNDSYAVGVPELDDQHRRLLELINQVGDDYGPRNAFTDGLFREVLSDLFEYTQVHFRAEEDHLRKIAYPGIEAHAREHGALTERVMEFILAAQGGTQDRQAIHNFLLTWLVSHILEADMRYRDFMRAPLRPRGGLLIGSLRSTSPATHSR
ncbi:MAG: bacteriohemerythrin [Rhodocyclales bacterium]|nr:bacteriohemerythrin [Rhodocyclales bacterium]